MDRSPRFLFRYLLAALVGLILLLQVVGCSLSPSTTRTTEVTTHTASATITATTQVPELTQAQIRQISKAMAPSVVGVEAVMSRSGNQIMESVGTGVVYSSNGLIVTNNHVISTDKGTVSKSITVTLSNGKKYSASVVGRDTSVDLAVLRIRAHNLTPAKFRTDISTVVPGAVVVAIGNAKVLDRPVTSGRVIEVVEHANLEGMPGVQEVIESSAPLTNGNSGGPLVGSDGRVIGINTAEITSQDTAISLPANLVVQEVGRLISG